MIIADNDVLLINKPLCWTSFDVIRHLRRHNKIKKIGHAGTLDPLATGLLIICTGNKTKTISTYQHSVKYYTGIITLGAVTDSFDLEQPIHSYAPYQHITDAQIKQTAQDFLGEHRQIPPMFSAIKKDGKPLYLLARKGKEILVEAKTVHIYEFNITGIYLPYISFEIKCSSGTYIRSIANDFGKRLGCGAYLSKLERTQIGNFNLKDAHNIEFSKIE